MVSIEEIEQYIVAGATDRAIEALDERIEKNPDVAQLWYMRGKAYWKLGKRQNAISDFEEAVQLDPQSPALHALNMARDIMNFYNPDILNP